MAQDLTTNSLHMSVGTLCVQAPFFLQNSSIAIVAFVPEIVEASFPTYESFFFCGCITVVNCRLNRHIVISFLPLPSLFFAWLIQNCP